MGSKGETTLGPSIKKPISVPNSNRHRNHLEPSITLAVTSPTMSNICSLHKYIKQILKKSNHKRRKRTPIVESSFYSLVEDSNVANGTPANLVGRQCWICKSPAQALDVSSAKALVLPLLLKWPRKLICPLCSFKTRIVTAYMQHISTSCEVITSKILLCDLCIEMQEGTSSLPNCIVENVIFFGTDGLFPF